MKTQTFSALLVLSLSLPIGCSDPDEPGHPTREKAAEQPLKQAPPLEERLVHEEKSEFSHIRVKDRGNLRTLYFVEDSSGAEAAETTINVKQPERLMVPYTRAMFSSFLLRFPQDKVLIVGLGGGAMVRFLNSFFPRMNVDAVEIDPVVVRLAAELFGTEPSDTTRIFTEDAFRYIARTKDTYDVIYMDAYLTPTAGHDATGKPRRLKTMKFLRSLHDRLSPGGMVVFNMIAGPALKEDINAIRTAFPSTYMVPVTSGANVVIVGSLEPSHRPKTQLLEAGRRLDREFQFGFSLADIAERSKPLDSLYRPSRR